MAKMYFYYSAMNAGKTTTLLQSSHNYHERGMRTLLYCPSIDNRYGKGLITSRIGLSSSAISFEHDMNLYEDISNKIQQMDKVHCVLVDEAQFLSKDQVYQLTEVADKLNIPVLTYGLRTDFMGEPFEGSKYLLSWAEEVTEIKTICHCGRKATMNMRVDEAGQKVSDGAQIQIGGNESYVATCRVHFKSGHSIAKANQLEESIELITE